MNYLAHLLIAHETKTSLIGNFLGDFVKGPVSDLNFSEKTKQGIRLHRQVDSFTDTHPIFMRSKSLVSQSRKRYAGIYVDLAYDYFLSKHWELFCNVERTLFIQEFYLLLQDNMKNLPPVCSRVVEPMIQQDWLGRYVGLSGINQSLNGINRRIELRFNRQNPLKNSVEEIENNYQKIEKDFLSFFPELVNFSHASV